MEPSGYTLRPIRLGGDTDDLALLREIYASTRAEEVAQTGWPPEQIAAFLTQQFEAQHAHYQKHFPSADFDLILSEAGDPVGRLYLDEWAEPSEY